MVGFVAARDTRLNLETGKKGLIEKGEGQEEEEEEEEVGALLFWTLRAAQEAAEVLTGRQWRAVLARVLALCGDGACCCRPYPTVSDLM